MKVKQLVTRDPLNNCVRVCLNVRLRSIVNKNNYLNIMVENIDPHITGIT